MSSSCWLYGAGQAQLVPSHWDPHSAGGWIVSCLLVTFEIFVWFCLMDFELPLSSSDPALISALLSHWMKDFQKKFQSKEAAHRPTFERERPFSPASGRDKKQCSHPPSQTCLQAQHVGAASHLCSAQLLLTGKCLHLDSSSPLHSWLKIHFKTRFIYILITSAITITLPLLRNCSAACRSPSSSEISRNRALVVYRVWNPIECFGGNQRNPNGHLEIFCSPKFSLQVYLILVIRGEDRSDHFRKPTQSSVAFLN